ncbi:MAG: hypothetical protein DLM67_01490, partial [Candidatus Nephthysia bennettiae]
MNRIPILDGRQASQILEELLADVPGYLRYWRPQAGRSGYALLQFISRYSALVAGSLDGALGKAELAFLDAMGIDLLPPQAAAAPVVFELMPDSPVDAPLPDTWQALVERLADQRVREPHAIATRHLHEHAGRQRFLDH